MGTKYKSVACPKCGAGNGEPCRTEGGGYKTSGYHTARRKLWTKVNAK